MNWYCIHTKPLREESVSTYCTTTLGLEAYFPKLRQYRTIRRVRRLVTRPLFPRYLFCRINLATDYRAVRYAPDALDLVHLGPKPAIVPPELVEELRAWAGSTGDIITLQQDLQPGDQVEITSGPMRGLPAVILRTSSDRDRVAILLSTLQHGVQATISRSHLRRVE